jgi:hypothetical protein
MVHEGGGSGTEYQPAQRCTCCRYRV